MELSELRELQKLPLEHKIILTNQRIKEWYEYWNGSVYVSFSGGKDSTVLLDIVRNLYPEVPGVYVNTGLEYPEIKQFVKNKNNIVWLKPKMPFQKVIQIYGYPVVSKKVARFIRDLQNPTPRNEITRNLRITGYNQKGEYCPSMKIPKKWLKLVNSPFKISEQCCDIMKKEPFKRYVKETGRKPINGVMASESQRREKTYLMNGGCNAFRSHEPISTPIAFWTEQDVLQYIVENNLQYAECYGKIIKNENNEWITTGEKRTGCMFCLFGVHLEKGENRFQRMKINHPKQYEYCINKLGLGEILDFIGVNY